MTGFRTRAAALVVNNESILLVRHCRNGKSYFLLPGGGVEQYETVEDAIIREMAEETGYCAVPGRCVFITESESPDGKRKIRQLVHLCEISGKMGRSKDPIVAETLFMPLADFEKALFYPNIKKEIISAISNGFPDTPLSVKVTWE